MRKEDLFEAMSGIDNKLIERADSQKAKKPKGIFRLASAAAALIIIVAAVFLASGNVRPEVTEPQSSEAETNDVTASFAMPEKQVINGVTVKAIDSDEAPNGSYMADMAYLSEDEIINGLGRNKDGKRDFENTVVLGRITKIQNLELNFGSYGVDWKGDWIDYFAIVEIEVDEVYRGEIKPGERARVFAYFPIGNDDVWIEDGGVGEHMKEGMRGIFIFYRNTVNELGANGKTILISDLGADYCFGDALRYYFLETENGLLYADDEYGYTPFNGLHNPQTLEDVAEYVKGIIR